MTISVTYVIILVTLIIKEVIEVTMSIKSMRLKHGLTQTEFAAKIGVTQSAVSQWELGLNLPGTAKLKDIARVLNCKIDDLIGGEDA